jgi:hypothetical protein
VSVHAEWHNEPRDAWVPDLPGPLGALSDMVRGQMRAAEGIGLDSLRRMLDENQARVWKGFEPVPKGFPPGDTPSVTLRSCVRLIGTVAAGLHKFITLHPESKCCTPASWYQRLPHPDLQQPRPRLNCQQPQKPPCTCGSSLRALFVTTNP